MRIPIVQGEFRVVAEPDVMITTLLGSCIAVCLHDRIARVGGMNHFLLPEPGAGAQIAAGDRQRYGVHAMELLINAMMARGASRSRLRARVYGGATIVSAFGAIGADNAAFARRFLDAEGIEIGHTDVGGACPRKVEYLPFDGKARCIKVSEAAPPPRLVLPLPEAGDLELF